MRQLQPVLWTKGVLLTPQHLQTQDRFLEDLLRFQLSALSYAPWGAYTLRVDQEALAAGTVALSAAGGIFPDGLLYDAPDADPLPAPRPLAEAWIVDQSTLDVYLAVPERKPGAPTVATGAESGTRYTADVMLRRDEVSGLAERPIQVARKNVRLIFEGEPTAGSSTLRIARVRRGPAGDVHLDAAVVPPLLDFAASPPLLAIARRLVELLAAKSAALAGARRQKGQGLADFGATDIAPFWLLYTVNSQYPRLRHLYETRRGHPEALYAAMLDLAGALGTFAPAGDARALPPYDHLDLGRCFGELDVAVREMLEAAIPVGAVSLPLKLVRQSIHATALDEDRLLAAPAMYLAVSSDVPRAELLQRVPQLVKVCSADHIDALVRQALPGIALAHVASPPSAVPVKLDYQYFALSRTGPAWEAVARARNLAAYVPADLPNAQLELIVVLPPRR
jgi:type VI secretion system protein ImpJ